MKDNAESIDLNPWILNWFQIVPRLARNIWVPANTFGSRRA